MTIGATIILGVAASYVGSALYDATKMLYSRLSK